MKLALCFALGQLLQLLGQAKASQQSRSNGLTSIWQWMRLQWWILTIRGVLSWVIFGLTKDGLLSGILGHSIPVNPWFMIGLGYLADRAVDQLYTVIGGWFKTSVDIPHLSPPQ